MAKFVRSEDDKANITHVTFCGTSIVASIVNIFVALSNLAQ